MEYKEKGIANYADWDYVATIPDCPRPMFEGYQYWLKGGDQGDTYTPLFIDLLDDFNQLNHVFGRDTMNINDEVVGYPFPAIENVVYELRDNGTSNLIQKLQANKPSGITDLQISTLFENY